MEYILQTWTSAQQTSVNVALDCVSVTMLTQPVLVGHAWTVAKSATLLDSCALNSLNLNVGAIGFKSEEQWVVTVQSIWIFDPAFHDINCAPHQSTGMDFIPHSKSLIKEKKKKLNCPGPNTEPFDLHEKCLHKLTLNSRLWAQLLTQLWICPNAGFFRTYLVEKLFL